MISGTVTHTLAVDEIRFFGVGRTACHLLCGVTTIPKFVV
jgi:hypothetical protein